MPQPQYIQMKKKCPKCGNRMYKEPWGDDDWMEVCLKCGYSEIKKRHEIEEEEKHE
jgi:predicted nucleic-acid-binding Zn-ribbon protein